MNNHGYVSCFITCDSDSRSCFDLRLGNYDWIGISDLSVFRAVMVDAYGYRGLVGTAVGAISI